MPLRWRIDHPARRVAATLLDTTSEAEMYDFLGEVIAQGAMPYGKLFDVAANLSWLIPTRVTTIAATARLYTRLGLGPIGPLAIVLSSATARKPREECALLADAMRQVRVFRRHNDAEAWLRSRAADLGIATDAAQARKRRFSM